MKLNLLDLSTNSEELAAQLFGFFSQWQEDIDSAAPIFELEGKRLEGLARDVPHHQAFYAARAQDARAVVKWLEIQRAQREARHIKNYNNTNRALGAREQAVYVQGEKDVVEMNQLIVEAQLKQQHFDEIVEAIKQMGWMIGHITKLRVVEMQDAVL